MTELPYRLQDTVTRKKIFGEVISVLGQQDSLKSCIEGIILGNDIKQEFDKETLNEADKIPQTVTESQFAGREDLRDMIIFTIDGDDARDFDDAVSLTLKDNGNYYLGVHIADVSEYVKEGTALENEAYKRGTSVYLADRVILCCRQVFQTASAVLIRKWTD